MRLKRSFFSKKNYLTNYINKNFFYENRLKTYLDIIFLKIIFKIFLLVSISDFYKTNFYKNENVIYYIFWYTYNNNKNNN